MQNVMISLRRFGTAMVVGVIGTAFFTQPTQAALLNFTFSFSNTVGNVTGTVTGRVEGLSDNNTGAAAHVYIDTVPAGMNNSSLFALPPSIDVVGHPNVVANSFTTSGGQITGADFGTTPLAQYPDLAVNHGSLSFASLDNFATYVQNQGGLGSVTFAQETPLPEPAAVALLAVGGVVGLLRQRRRVLPGRGEHETGQVRLPFHHFGVSFKGGKVPVILLGHRPGNQSRAGRLQRHRVQTGGVVAGQDETGT